MIEHTVRIGEAGDRGKSFRLLEISTTTDAATDISVVLISITSVTTDAGPRTIMVTRDDFVDAVDLLRLYGGSKTERILDEL